MHYERESGMFTIVKIKVSASLQIINFDIIIFRYGC